MKPITIIGGGLAGLRLGILLRENHVPVTIYEAGHYPRHRVCGEFISGAGQGVIRCLGIPSRPAHTAAFVSANTQTRFDLPRPALCVSRYELDNALAQAFVDLGGTLVCGKRVQQRGEGIVHATGRRLHAVESGWRWFGLKAHATGIQLAADLEMHFVPNGYIGICRLPEDRINVCGLFRKRKGDAERITLADALGPKFKAANWIEGASAAVSGLCFCPPQPNGECHIGDANAMIAPLTGNGMSMAFESAEAAFAPLLAYSRLQMSWESAVRRINRALGRFRGRLTWGKWLQRAAFCPSLMPFCARPSVRKLLFAATR